MSVCKRGDFLPGICLLLFSGVFSFICLLYVKFHEWFFFSLTFSAYLLPSFIYHSVDVALFTPGKRIFFLQKSYSYRVIFHACVLIFKLNVFSFIFYLRLYKKKITTYMIFSYYIIIKAKIYFKEKVVE